MTQCVSEVDCFAVTSCMMTVSMRTAGGKVAGGDGADSAGTAGQGPARFTGEHTSHCRYLPAGSFLAAYIFARPFTVSPSFKPKMMFLREVS
jgi:hypothetical protein